MHSDWGFWANFRLATKNFNWSEWKLECIFLANNLYNVKIYSPKHSKVFPNAAKMYSRMTLLTQTVVGGSGSIFRQSPKWQNTSDHAQTFKY